VSKPFGSACRVRHASAPPPRAHPRRARGAQNNMTYDLMRMACLMGFHINVAGPDSKDFEVPLVCGLSHALQGVLSSCETG
jgi:hypothetical protein